MKVLVTGAHFTPAVATIEELKKIAGVEVVYVGRKSTQEGDSSASVESTVLPALGVKFIGIITGRLQRAFTIHTIPSLLKIPVGLLQAFFIVLTERPDVILSFGGYVAIPTVLVGWLFSVPIIIHEQAIVSGLANKISSVFADKIAVSFTDSFKGEKVILTGNPIRREIVRLSRGVSLAHPRGGLHTVLIMGGSQGSHAINQAMEGCLVQLTKIVRVVHISGDNKFRDFERLEEKGKLNNFGERYVVRKWIGEEYAQNLQNADLVICRAGINTLTELAFLGIPALVIPIPSHYEQNKNAKYFANLKLAKVLPQSQLSAETLLKNVKKMLKDLERLKKTAKGAKILVVTDAAKRLALETVLLKI